MSTLWESIKKGLKDGAKIAKDGAQVAAEKAEELSKKSKIMYDIHTIKGKIESNFTELGGKIYHLIHVENAKNIAARKEVKELISTVSTLETELKEKQEELNKIGIAYQAETDSAEDGEPDEKSKE